MDWFRSHLKKVFWPNLGVGAGFKILDIRQYACGLKPGPVYTLDQNPFFEIGSNQLVENRVLCLCESQNVEVGYSAIFG